MNFHEYPQSIKNFNNDYDDDNRITTRYSIIKHE